MTYAQLRLALASIARHGEQGCPAAAIGVQRAIMLREAGCVVYDDALDRWQLTTLGRTILGEQAMPRTRPANRPSHHRRTPSIGHAQPAMRKLA